MSVAYLHVLHMSSVDGATTTFRYALSITISDPDHTDSENRFVDIGVSHRMDCSAGCWLR